MATERHMKRGLAVLALVGAVVPVASCNLVLGLTKYKDCPGDATCPSTSTATCTDGVKDGDETGTDCGGSCTPCADGDGCLTGGDCADKVCSKGACQAPSCTDGVQNGTETGLDCGGSCGATCMVGEACASNGDCRSMACSPTAKTCQASCTDGQKDGDETGVDCGGSCPTKCPEGDGGGCLVDADCQSGICQSPMCVAVEVWATSFQDASATSGATPLVAVDGTNDVILGGTFPGSFDFGGGKVSTTSGFLAKFDPTGTYLWQETAATSGASSSVNLVGVAADPLGQVYVTGSFTGYGSLGTNSMCDLTNAPSGAVWVGKLASAGNPLWCAQYLGSGTGSLVAVDGVTENIVVAGTIGFTTINFGGGAVSGSVESNGDLFVLQLDPTGKYVWAQTFRGGAHAGSQPTGLAIDAAHNVVVGGSLYDSSAAIGTTNLQGSFFLGEFNPTGGVLWVNGFGAGGAGPGNSTFVAVDAARDVFYAGSFSGSVDFGSGMLTSAGGTDIFLAKFDSKGNCIWSKSYGDAQNQVATALSVDANGQPILTGNFEGTVTFGTEVLTSTGGTMAGDNIYLAKFDTNGNALWSRRFGDAHGQYPTSIAVDGTGAALLTGTFSGTLDFSDTTPSMPLKDTPSGATDVFLAKLRTP